MTVVFIINAQEVPLYRATAQLLIKNPQATGVSSVEAREASASGTNQYFDTQLEIIKGMKLARRVVNELDLSSLPEFSGPFPEVALVYMLSVEPVENSRLVNVTVDCPDPELSAKIANTLVDIYVKQNIEDVLYVSRELLKTISGESLDTDEPLTVEEKEKLLETLPSVISDATLRGLKTQRSGVEADIANLSRRYKHKHPKMISANTQLEALNGQISRQTAMVVENVKADLTGKLRVNNIRIVERARVPLAPLESKKITNLLRGAALSLFLGLGLIFLLDKMDKTVKTQDDIQPYLRIPFLGSLPNLGKLPRNKHGFALLKEIDGDMLASTAIREIRTALTFSTHEKAAAKIITITSAIPGEGKSFFATYLAYSFAKNGVKTLLVDGDLRIPQVHTFFDIKNEAGVSELVRGEISRESAAVETGMENLSILPAGKTQSDPAEVFSAVKTNQAIQELTHGFDKIIIDAPPALLIPDALVLSKISDTTLLVVRADRVELKALLAVKSKFEAIGSTIMGFVLNGLNLKRDAYYSRYYKSYSKKTAVDLSEPDEKKRSSFTVYLKQLTLKLKSKFQTPKHPDNPK